MAAISLLHSDILSIHLNLRHASAPMPRRGSESSRRQQPSQDLAPARPSLITLAPAESNSEQPSPNAESPNGGQNATGDDARNTVAPRSRKGCWTCRTRKVKCDEVQPVCGPCHRLNHLCDYRTRLGWRDDNGTAERNVRQTRSITLTDCPAWDPRLAGAQSPLSARPQDDDLPPFSRLTNDEERERKASFHPPGMYLVVSTPELFAELPEYAEMSDSHRNLSVNGDGLYGQSTTGTSEDGDPTVVVLGQHQNVYTQSESDQSYVPHHVQHPVTWPTQELSIHSYPTTITSLPYQPNIYTTMAPQDFMGIQSPLTSQPFHPSYMPQPLAPSYPPQDWSTFGTIGTSFPSLTTPSYSYGSSLNAPSMPTPRTWSGIATSPPQHHPQPLPQTLPFAPTLSSTPRRMAQSAYEYEEEDERSERI